MANHAPSESFDEVVRPMKGIGSGVLCRNFEARNEAFGA